MNKILVVGHESSNYQMMMEIVQSYGVLQALPSQLYQMTPQQLTKKILQMTKPQEVSKIYNDKHLTHNEKTQRRRLGRNQSQRAELSKPVTPYEQKYPEKMWDGLMMDLMLANSDQPLWGWADSQAISLLDYWAKFDKEMAFILTYDQPSNILKNLILENKININDLTQDKIVALLQDWMEYNKEILAFYRKYPTRCLLVNSEQVAYSTQDYIDSIAKFAQIELLDHNIQLPPTLINKTIHDFSLLNFLICEMLSDNHDVHATFSQLQDLASIPLVSQKRTSSMLDFLKESIKNQRDLVDACQRLDDLKQVADKNSQEWQTKLVVSKQNHEKDRSALRDIQTQLSNHQQENCLLTSQLHQTQEELERYYHENKKSIKLLNQEKKRLSQLEKSNRELSKKSDELSKLVSQLNKEKQEINEQKLKSDELAKQESQRLAVLKKQLDDELVRLAEQNKKLLQENSSKTNQINLPIQQENELLIKQLHQTQEELERYYLENQRLKSTNVSQQNSVNVTNIPKQSEQHIYYGAADRVKQDLPYRLGATMVSYSKSTKDLVKLPLALMKEYRQFQKKDGYKDLPPLEVYQDAHEAEKVKKHLSYRLGRVLVDGFKSPKSVVDLPVKLGREIVRFKRS